MITWRDVFIKSSVYNLPQKNKGSVFSRKEVVWFEILVVQLARINVYGHETQWQTKVAVHGIVCPPWLYDSLFIHKNDSSVIFTKNGSLNIFVKKTESYDRGRFFLEIFVSVLLQNNYDTMTKMCIVMTHDQCTMFCHVFIVINYTIIRLHDPVSLWTSERWIVSHKFSFIELF